MTPTPPAWTWRSALRRARQLLREEGARSLAFRALSEARLLRRTVLVERFVADPLGDITPGVPLQVGTLREEEADACAACSPYADAAEVRRRLRAGQRCFVAYHQGRLVHASWMASERVWIRYLERYLEVPPGDFYVYESFTDPAYRGQRILPAVAACIIEHGRATGRRRGLWVVMPENRATFHSTARTGHHPIALLGYLRLGRWRRDFTLRLPLRLPLPRH